MWYVNRFFQSCNYLICTLQDSSYEFEKRRHIPVRYNRELVQTTIMAMKRVGEVKKRREHGFWENRMVGSRNRLRAHKQKKLLKKSASVKLVEPVAMETEETEEPERIQEKIKVPASSRSALIPGEGRSMGMDID